MRERNDGGIPQKNTIVCPCKAEEIVGILQAAHTSVVVARAIEDEQNPRNAQSR